MENECIFLIRRDAGSGDWHPPLAASVPEWQEALSILLVRCGCVWSCHLVRFSMWSVKHSLWKEGRK